MAQFIIKGGKPLRGRIAVQGAKNAATPCLAASLLFQGEVHLKNIPNIVDVERMKDILSKLGVRVKSQPHAHSVVLNAAGLSGSDLDFPEVHQMRSSILLIGPLLARFGKVKIPYPGGCRIGARQIDTHLDAFRAMGAKIRRDQRYYYLEAKRLRGRTILLSEFSVTATENILMTACAAEGETTIKLAAMEPHVQDLAHFLKKGGAQIEGIGTHTITVQGPKGLIGCTHAVIPDMIEAGTLIIAALITRGEVLVTKCNPEHLEIFLQKIKQVGGRLRLKKNSVEVLPTPSFKPVNIQTLPYPGFPTDLQAPFAVLLLQAKGKSLIHDPLYENRLMYIRELKKMGATARILDPHRALLWGPAKLVGREIRSFDLRAGATLLLAALVAKGQSTIEGAQEVDRGYEKIAERLRKLGADITRKE